MLITSTSPGIVIRNACLSIDKHLIFDHLNCDITAGKFTCLLGPSGIGKSTLLRMIADIIDIKNAIFSADIKTDINLPIDNNIAYMAQNDLLLPWLNTLKNVLLGARLRKQMNSKKVQKAKYLLRQVGLQDAIKKHPAELSGGMRQRVALARTLMEEKSIILMDEPFSALDAITRLNLQNLAAKSLKGKTVLLVTHDPLEALRLGDIVHVMTGQPAQMGEPIYPTGDIPRKTTDKAILELQGELLQRLQNTGKTA